MRAWWVTAVLLASTLAWPAHPAQEAPKTGVALSDPPDDTGIRPLEQVPNVPVAGVAAADILGFRARFGVEGLLLEVRLRGLHVGGADIYPDMWFVAVRFSFAETECRFTLVVVMSANVARAPAGIGATLMDGPAFAQIQTMGPCQLGGPFPASIDAAEATVRMTLPWSALAHTWSSHLWRTPPFDLTRAPSAIDEFEATAAVQMRNPADVLYLLSVAWVTDRVPDALAPSTQRLALPHAWPNSDVALSIAAADGRFVVEAGSNHSVKFAIANRMPHPVVVRLNYTLVDDGTDVTGTTVLGPSSVRVPSGQTRNYTAFVQRAQVDRPVQLEITGQAIPGGARSVDRVTLAAGDPLGPGRNVLGFAALPAAPQRSYELAVMCPGGLGPGIPTIACHSRPIMSRAVRPPGYESHGEVQLPPGNFPTVISSWPVAQPLALAKGGAIELELPLRFNRPARDVRAHAALSHVSGEQRQAVLQMEEERELVTGEETFVLRGTLRREWLLPEQGSFLLEVQVLSALLPGEMAPDVYLQVAGARLALPLVEVPEEHRAAPRPAPFQIEVRGETEEFVNPGKARLFRLEILNIDSMEHRVRLESLADAPGWRLEAHPGTVFVLPPGSSVNVGLLVTAPAEAADGSRARIFVNATADDGTKAGVRLSTVVVHEVDLEDDRDAYVAGPDDLALVERTAPPATPTTGALVAALVVIGLAGRRRGSSR